MRNSILNSMILCVVTVATLAGCNKQDSGSSGSAPVAAPVAGTPAKTDAPSSSGDASSVASDVDGRVFGSWSLKNSQHDRNGKEISGSAVVLKWTIAKGKFTAESEIISNGVTTCTAEASTNKFSLTKDHLMIDEAFDGADAGSDDKGNCSMSMAKSDFVYRIESNDVLVLTLDGGTAEVKMDRVK